MEAYKGYIFPEVYIKTFLELSMHFIKMQFQIPCKDATDRAAYGAYNIFGFEREIERLSKSEEETNISATTT